MKVLLTGANGMLGRDLCPYLENIGCFVIPTDFESLDVTNYNNCNEIISKIHPDLIIHCAAYTNVDKAEEEKEKAQILNVEGAKNIAQIAQKINATMVYISTDYVFDGKKSTPYTTKDKPNPINHYGLTKYQGELEVQKYCKKHFIIRTSWLYGINGANFVEKIIELAKKQDVINVVNDQKGCPTWTFDLIQGILKILNKPYGIYHISGSNPTTWFEFACKIIELKKLNTKVKPCTSVDFKQNAKRPKYSVLENSIDTRNWLESLQEYLKLRKES